MSKLNYTHQSRLALGNRAGHNKGIAVSFVLFAFALVASGCGGSSGGSGSGSDSIVALTSTDDLKNNASVNIGGSLDSTLDGVSSVITGSDTVTNDPASNIEILTDDDGNLVITNDPENTDISELWNDDAQSFVDTSLNLGNDENTVRDGDRITIDPDDAAVCAEELVDISEDEAEFQRCVALISDMLVQIDATSDTAGSMTYLFQEQPLVVIGYADNSNSFEINLGTLKTLLDAEIALNPESNSDSPLDTISGAIRLSAVATNTTSGAEAGSVAVEVSQALEVASADAGTTLSLGTGQIFGVTADAASESVSFEVAVGALQASVTAVSYTHLTLPTNREV